jgi:hypothetical protein
LAQRVCANENKPLASHHLDHFFDEVDQKFGGVVDDECQSAQRDLKGHVGFAVRVVLVVKRLVWHTKEVLYTT